MEFAELKQALKEKYLDIWDVIYDAQRSKLAGIEECIQHFADDPELVRTLTLGFGAEVEVAARQYRAAIGNRFYFHKQKDFLDETLRKPYLFDSEGRFRGATDGTIHSFTAFSNYTIDLCFGNPEQLKEFIVSEVYVPMRRPDYSDYKIMTYLQHVKKTQGFNRETMKLLVNAKIAERIIS